VNPRTTAVLFVLVAALGAFVWFYEIGGEAGRKDAEAAAKRLFPGVEASAVEQVELTTSDGQRARLERRDTDWEVVAPLAAPADGFAADAIARLGSSGAKRLQSPSRSRSTGWRGGTRIQFGPAPCVLLPLETDDRRPTRLRHRPTRVYRHGSVNALSILDDLREADPALQAGDVARVTARWPGGEVALSRGEGGWGLEQPIVGPADETTVEELLSDLSFLRASGFVDAPTPEQEGSLAAPELEVELAMRPEAEGKEPRTLTLAIGAREGGQGDRLARAGGPALVRIPTERLRISPRGPSASVALADPARPGAEIVFQPPGGAR
jgi:hypothetical protein